MLQNAWTPVHSVARMVLATAFVLSSVATAEPPSDQAAASQLHKVAAWKDSVQRSIIRDFFRGHRDGVFVDVGAAHYRDGSMTFFLEEEFGWSGVAVDALEHWGADYAKYRPRTRFFNHVVTDHAGAAEPFYRMTGNMGDIHSTALKQRADKLVEEWEGVAFTEVLVPTITLDDLLGRASITKIDFLSMDIEGGELAALAGFDIERFRPWLVGVEVHASDPDEMLAYFEQHAYRRIDAYLERVTSDWFFTCKVEAVCAREPAAPGPEEPADGSKDLSSEPRGPAR